MNIARPRTTSGKPSMIWTRPVVPTCRDFAVVRTSMRARVALNRVGALMYPFTADDATTAGDAR